MQSTENESTVSPPSRVIEVTPASDRCHGIKTPRPKVTALAPLPFIALAALAAALSPPAAATPRLKVSENKYHLVTETGAPFFWFGESANKFLGSRRADSKQ